MSTVIPSPSSSSSSSFASTSATPLPSTSPSGAATDVDAANFTFGVRLGMFIIVECASLSALAVVGLLSYIGYSALRKSPISRRRRWSTVTHVHIYFVSMLVSDLVQALGGILNIRWIHDAGVTQGALCTTQGILKQMGDVGVALASLAIALHTFAVLVLKWRPSPSARPAFFVISGIWLFITLNIGISAATHRGKQYWGDTEYWCWITPAYPVQQIALEYAWMWLTSLLSILLYIPIALIILGWIAVDGYKVRWIRAERRRDRKELGLDKEKEMRTLDAGAVARQMLFYPLLYILTTLPISIARFRAFHSQSVPFAYTVFADSVFASSGMLNVALYTITRPSLLPSRDRSQSSSGGPDYSSPNSLNGGPTFSLPFNASQSFVSPGREMRFSYNRGYGPFGGGLGARRGSTAKSRVGHEVITLGPLPDSEGHLDGDRYDEEEARISEEGGMHKKQVSLTSSTDFIEMKE